MNSSNNLPTMLAVGYLKYNCIGGLHNKLTVPQYVNRPVRQALGGMHSPQTLRITAPPVLQLTKKA